MKETGLKFPGYGPNSLAMASNSLAMASNSLAMASNSLAMAPIPWLWPQFPGYGPNSLAMAPILWRFFPNDISSSCPK